MNVNADFPFQNKFLNIHGSKIHYVEEGGGENPVLFLHGNPTSSYLWRNIIPTVAGKNNRCIALDLIGFGKSDKPDIDYNFRDHYKYVKEFIARLGLENNNNLIIVGHDWGGVLGFWYAFNHQENIKGIAFMETFPFTLSINDFPPEFAKLLQAFRTQGSGYELIQVQNIFVEQVIPSAVFNKQNLSEAIMRHYREPFPTIESRKPIRRFPEMLPLDSKVESEAYTIIQKLETALSGHGDDSNDGIGKTELLRLVAIAESGSEHPLGQAVVRKAREKEYGILVPNPDSFEALSGHGVRATYSGHTILVGNRRLMDDNKIPVTEKVDSFLEQIENEGKTAALVSIDNKLSGIIALADTIKEDAKEGIDSLKSMGMEVIMRTGDNERSARTIATKLGIKRVIAQVLPQQKEEVISKLKTEREGKEREGKVVAMVGDGINDAPALARADLGIAIGSGTDVAKETGGIILIKGNVRDVATAIDLGKKTVSKIKQNLFWAFAYNTGLIPVAAGALVPLVGVNMFGWLPLLAGAAMAMSSVTVVGNSILLGRYKPKFEVIKQGKGKDDRDIYSNKEFEQTHTISQTSSKKQR